MSKEKLFDAIGSERVASVITKFYERAFRDPIISHFFIKHDQQELTRKQILFATAMLGGPASYEGPSLSESHRKLTIRAPHFGRRQVLMRQVLLEEGISQDLIDGWMRLEEKLRRLVVSERHPPLC